MIVNARVFVFCLWIAFIWSVIMIMLSCQDDQRYPTNPMGAMVDGMYIGPNPDGIFPLFKRHKAVLRSDRFDIEITPHARDGSVFLVTMIRNRGRASIWLVTKRTSFWIAPDYLAKVIRVVKAAGSSLDKLWDDGLAAESEEILPNSQRAFFVEARWENLSRMLKNS